MLAIADARALADPIPGAAYTGAASDGGQVAFTVSADGTLISSYELTSVGNVQCQLIVEQSTGWEGAPIVGGAFDYELPGTVTFQGSFPGSQSAKGTFRLYSPATDARPACDSGTLSWTATTTATPRGGPPGNPGQPGQPGSNNGGKGTTKSKFSTTVGLHALSRKLLGGSLSSKNSACRIGRVVILWRGAHRVGSTRTKRNGSYTFRRSSRLHGRHVRASVATLTLTTAICTAATSKFING